MNPAERTTSGRERRDPVLWGVVAATTALRVWLAWHFFGFLGGDDVEVLEEALRVAAGLRYSPWNLRNLLLPDTLVAPFIRLAIALGIHDPGALAFVATIPLVALASLNIILVYRLARAWCGDIATARLSALLYAFHWLPLAYGSTVYPRTASTTCVLLAAAWVSGGRRDTLRAAGAGAAVAVAFADRYSEAVFLLPLVLLAWSRDGGRRSIRRCSGLAGGFAAGAMVTVGAYDTLTWGSPFASLVEFAKATLVERAFASRIPLQPPLFYLQRLLFWCPPTLVPALVAAWRRRSVRAAWAFVAVPVVVLSLIAHKEVRYLQGAIPFLAILGAAGFVALSGRWRRSVVGALLVLTVASEVFGVRVLAGKSMAAVTAARRLAADRSVRVVALSQSWAYGGRAFLGNGVEVRDLPTPPDAHAIDAATPGAEAVGVYLNDLQAHPAVRAALARNGFAERERVEWGESKTVVVFRAGRSGR